MNLRKISLLGILICMPFGSLSAQFVKGMNYNIEANVGFSGGENTPLWLNANRYGLSSVEKNNGYLRAGIFRPYEDNRIFSYRLGLDLAVAYHSPSVFVVQQAYFDIRARWFELSIGSKERPLEMKNQELSSGGLTFSKNARPVPQVRIGIPEYLALDKKKLFSIKGHIAYGMFTDDRWQKSFIASDSYVYTQNVLYHSKALFAKIGNEDRFPLVVEGSLEMATQFGGRSYNQPGFEPYLDMPNGIKDFFKAFVPSGSDATDGIYANVAGNHLGSWDFALSYKFPKWKIRGYYEHFFEDHSMMFGEYGWKDCLAGVEITLPQNRIVETVVYEYLGTKDQSGAIYHDHTPQIPDQVSARDDYYNHGIYTGWQHWGQAMGNPFITSPAYNKDGQLEFQNNRIKAHHLGIAGQPCNDVRYRALFSHSRNWGKYDNPFDDVKTNFSLLLEATYSPRKLKGWNFTASFALDHGQLLGNNAGGMLVVRKCGFLSKHH